MIYLLSNQQIKGVHNLPSIQIKYLHQDIDFDAKYLLFTSKNGVLALDKIDKKWKEIPAICIGEPTAKMVKKLGGIVKYVGQKSYGDDLALEIVQNFTPTKILFPRAKEVLSNIVEVLEKHNFDVVQKIVYETQCAKISNFPKEGIFIFTSPSSVKCFLSQTKWKEGYKAVAIGTKTASVFPYKITISNIQTIQNCIQIAKNML